jgi:hypothetical protein
VAATKSTARFDTAECIREAGNEYTLDAYVSRHGLTKKSGPELIPNPPLPGQGFFALILVKTGRVFRVVVYKNDRLTKELVAGLSSFTGPRFTIPYGEIDSVYMM